MSGEPSDDTTGQLRPEGDNSDEKVETANENEGDVMPSPQEEEAAIKKKYGGIVPRKAPLISKIGLLGSKEEILKNLKDRSKHFDQNYSLLNSKLVHVGFLMHLLTTKRVSIRPLNFELHSGHVVSTTFCCSMFDTCNNL